MMTPNITRILNEERYNSIIPELEKVACFYIKRFEENTNVKKYMEVYHPEITDLQSIYQWIKPDDYTLFIRVEYGQSRPKQYIDIPINDFNEYIKSMNNDY